MSDCSPDLRVADFDYELPAELIAQTPLPERDRSRLMVVQRTDGTTTDTVMTDLPRWLRPGDLLVANNSRVIPARLKARRSTGGVIEFLLLHKGDDGSWSALARPARRLKMGEILTLTSHSPQQPSEASLQILDRGAEGHVRLRLLNDAEEHLDQFGIVPLPPYIRESLVDAERYQTLYASVPGSAAAPTAGLHISSGLRDALKSQGVGWAEVTLHIGLDTFRPVTVERVAEHQIHSEWCVVSDDVAQQIAQTRQDGGRIIALGTTAARTLETLGQRWETTPEARGRGVDSPTRIFITPGYQWRLVDAMVTNFHLPRSTLLMMVSSLAGRELIFRAYNEAIQRSYRFFSFGDAMLIV